VSAFDPRLTPARGDLAAASLRGLVDAERYADGETFTVVHELVDVKRAPRPDAPLDTQLLFGEVVTVYDEDDGWAWVQAVGDGYVGYVAAAALARGVDAPTHRVVVERTLIYPAADMKRPIIGAIPLGGEVVVKGASGAFSRLDHGFVFSAHLAPREVVAPDFVEVAERFIGTPYLWGGKSSLGIDCSGLVQIATMASGLSMPRDTDLQARVGDSVSFDNDIRGLQRGDLVYWTGHTGIMRDAKMLLHANAHHMLVASEPLEAARERIRAGSGNDVTSVRRLKIA
jgi:cell wall-associated NlpC family hydrolase